ncbi:hypothetical protein GF325_13000, partial [Candidatus Bathyarchaeota archaeon]|nr:hypothetical protein [Candidatus Bathyarchaeota archaeon]
MNKWCSPKKSILGFFMLMFLFMPLIPTLVHTSTKTLGFGNIKKSGGFTCTSTAPLDFPCFWNDTAFQERKQQAIEEIISSNTYNESLGIIGDSGTGVRTQGYHVLSILQSNNDSLANLSRASSVITSLHEKYQIREKYRGARQYGGFLKELDMDLDEYDGNYANFMAPFLGCIALEHREDLTPPARRHLNAMLKILSSCVHAQDNHVDYTNMFLLRVYSLLLLGEYFNDDSMRYEARHHWEKWMDLVLREGFPEHNSPNYGFIDAWALEGIYMHSVDRHMQLQARAILEWFWMDYGQHYHPFTGYHAGSGARVKNSDRYYGIGSHQNPLFMYFNEGSGIASSSASRMFTIKNYMPPEYVKEVTLEKEYPFHVKTRNFGTDTYTYMTQDYSFGTESGCKYPSKAGYTASQISGERLPSLITYVTNHSRKSAVVDTNPHYQAITSLQDGSTAILLVNFDVPEKRKSDEIYLEAWVGSRTALESIQGEIRVNNITWTGDPVALEDGDRLTVKINNTFIGFCPVASQVDHVDDSLLDNSWNTVLRWEENHDAGSEDL